MYILLVHPRYRTCLAMLLCIGAYALAPTTVALETRLLIAWNAGTIFLLAALSFLICGSDAESTFQRSQKEEPDHRYSLIVVVLTCGVGLGGAAIMYDNTQDMSLVEKVAHLALSLLTVTTAWLLVHVYFALQYARIYYDEVPGSPGHFAKGFDFPETEKPDYWDFIYFAFTIALCYQTSDVTITARHLRRLTILHALVSFFFVTGILGVVINVVTSL